MSPPKAKTPIEHRKADHIDLCATGDVGFHHKTTLLEQVDFLHDALPENSLEGVDLRVERFGRRLRVPIVIAAMTGGTPRAKTINRQLATIAQARGYAFGLGSQRPMLKDPAQRSTYDVRDVAPDVLIFGNLGAVQACTMRPREIADLCASVGADALCIHLNPAMELVQPGGDRDFRGIVKTLQKLVEKLPIPVIAKETGCGLSPRTLSKLAQCGVRHVDVSGAGGTSWVAVESERAQAEQRALGVALREWGVPTAASVAFARRCRPKMRTIIATGGIKNGVDAARAIALGADLVGIARPVLQALLAGGPEQAQAFLDQVESELRAVMLLTGCANVAELQKTRTVLGPGLMAWLGSVGP